jgi:hypothetical protein
MSTDSKQGNLTITYMTKVGDKSIFHQSLSGKTGGRR